MILNVWKICTEEKPYTVYNISIISVVVIFLQTKFDTSTVVFLMVMGFLQVREYRGRVREMENRYGEVHRQREGTEREVESLSLALTAAQERLRASEAQHTFDLEAALVKLEDEQTRFGLVFKF